MRKLQESLIKGIQKLYDKGLPPYKISKKTGVNYRTVHGYVRAWNNGCKDTTEYMKKYLKKKGFPKITDYHTKLAVEKGFDSNNDYNDYLAKKRGFGSLREYQEILVIEVRDFGSWDNYNKWLKEKKEKKIPIKV